MGGTLRVVAAVLALALVTALTLSFDQRDESSVLAQRGGGGGKGGGGGGKGGVGGKGGKGMGKGGKGGPGGIGKMGKGVNADTQMADWKQPRDSTWERAKKDKLPIVMVFMPISAAANPAYYIGPDVAKISRGKSYWVQVLEYHHQFLKGERGYKEPEPEPEEDTGASDDAEGEEDEAEAPEDDKKPADEKKPADDKKDKSFTLAGSLGGAIKGQAAPSAPGAPADGAAPPAPPLPAIRAPGEKLYHNNLWKSFGVTKPDTFLLLDHLGNEYKRWDGKPPVAALVAEIEKMPKSVESNEKALAKDLEDLTKAREKGDLKGSLKRVQTAFERGRYGYESTDKIVAIFEAMLKEGREKLEDFEDAGDVKGIESLAKDYAGTILEMEAKDLAAKVKAKPKGR